MAPRKAAVTQLSAAQNLRDKINGLLGPGTIKMASDSDLLVEMLPSGVLPIDVLLDGGLPRGRITEVFGDFSTLKSLIAYCLIAETQSSGGVAALVDTEHAFDPQWAENMGVDVGALLMPPVVTGEEAVDVIQALVASGVDLVVWDSIAATLPQDEANKRLSKENIQPARLAALMSAAMRRINAVNKKTAILCINQTRTKVGIVFGNPESIPGGKALPFYASYRIAMRKAGKITEDAHRWDGEKLVTVKKTIGVKMKCELLKSKLSSPDRTLFFVWDPRKGEIDTIGFLIAAGLEHGLIKLVTAKGKPKKWTMGSQTWTGDAAFRGYLASSPKAKSTIRTAALAGGRGPGSPKVVVPKGKS